MYIWILPLFVGIVALAMSAVLAKRYLEKRRIHHLLWAVGLLLWSLSDFTQLYALLLGWTVPVYLIYFFCSIMLAGFLGAGTLCLVFPKNWIATAYVWFNVIFAIALAISLIVIPINVAALQNPVAGANPISSALVNDIAEIVNTPALFTFVGGALYGFVRSKKIYALLIAIGGAIPAVGGILAMSGMPQYLPYTDFLGIIFLSLGFYLSFKVVPKAEERKGDKRH
jgi:hypothetical protein